MAFDEAQFDRLRDGVQPVVQCQAHNPIWVARAYDDTTDNGGTAIVDPHDGLTITDTMMSLIGSASGARLIPLAPGTGSFDITHLASTTGQTTTVQIWRVHPTPGGIWPSGVGGRTGLGLGVLENATWDGAANTLALTAVNAAAQRFYFSTGAGGEMVVNRPTTGTRVYMGAWQSFAARGASHVLVTVQARSGGISSAVIIKTY